MVMADFDIKKFNQHSPSGSTCKTCVRQATCSYILRGFCIRYRYRNAPAVNKAQPEPMRICKTCGRKLPLSQFPKYGDYVIQHCYTCRRESNNIACDKRREKRAKNAQAAACDTQSEITEQVPKNEEEATQKALETTIAELKKELAELKAQR